MDKIEKSEDLVPTQNISIPAGKPHVLIVFESEGSALASVHKDKVAPAQMLGIAMFLFIEAAWSFVVDFQRSQRIITPGKGH